MSKTEYTHKKRRQVTPAGVFISGDISQEVFRFCQHVSRKGQRSGLQFSEHAAQIRETGAQAVIDLFRSLKLQRNGAIVACFPQCEKTAFHGNYTVAEHGTAQTRAAAGDNKTLAGIRLFDGFAKEILRVDMNRIWRSAPDRGGRIFIRAQEIAHVYQQPKVVMCHRVHQQFDPIGVLTECAVISTAVLIPFSAA